MYTTGTENDPNEDEEEENMAGKFNQPPRNPFGGSHGWAEENMARACLQRAWKISEYTMGTANKPTEDKEEENVSGNCKQLARNPVWGSHSWGNENAPMLAPCTLGIHGERRED